MEAREDEHLRVAAAHAGAEVGDARVGLLAPAQVGRRNEDVAHREHPKATELLRRVEDGRLWAGRNREVSGASSRARRGSHAPGSDSASSS